VNGTRLARNLSAGVVATIAAWSSYSHMVHVALRFGERAEVAYVLPLSVDGMLVVASAAMVDDKRSGRTVRWSARAAFVVGVVASIAANVTAAHPSVGARIVAGWPALALLLVVEMLSRSGRPAAVASMASPLVAQVVDPASAGGEVEPATVEVGADLDPVGEVEDALAVAARTVAGELRAEGRRPTRDALAKRLRDRGHAVSTDRASALARELARA